MANKHIGVVAVSTEGAALCYRMIFTEGSDLLGQMHREVTMHTFREPQAFKKSADVAVFIVPTMAPPPRLNLENRAVWRRPASVRYPNPPWMCQSK